MIHARAPGKLFLSGEYAVLEGAPAIACAIGRDVTVKLCRGDVAEAPEATRWREAAEQQLRLHGIDGFPAGGRMVIDSRALHSPDGTKYGLGASAAVAAAVTGALLASCGPLPGRQLQLDLARALHRQLQGPGGSGVDVAASVHGGVISMCGDHVHSLGWPAGLLCAVIWSGQDADTSKAIGRFHKALKNKSGPAAAALARLATAASAVTAAWTGDAGAVLAELEQYAVTWQELDRSADLGVFSLPHRRLFDLAHAEHCVYKPSGAGGGDCGLAFSCEPDRLERMRLSALKAGFALLDVDLAAEGLQVSRYAE